MSDWVAAISKSVESLLNGYAERPRHLHPLPIDHGMTQHELGTTLRRLTPYGHLDPLLAQRLRLDHFAAPAQLQLSPLVPPDRPQRIQRKRCRHVELHLHPQRPLAPLGPPPCVDGRPTLSARVARVLQDRHELEARFKSLERLPTALLVEEEQLGIAVAQGRASVGFVRGRQPARCLALRELAPTPTLLRHFALKPHCSSENQWNQPRRRRAFHFAR